MTRLSLREIQQEELNLLLQFHEFCKEKNLIYYLCGGTLLGAVRHKGFIPWDDDIDISMPRPDYERMIQMIRNKETDLQVRAFELGNFEFPYAKLINPNLEVKLEYSTSKASYLWLDIFPIDGLPDSLKETEALYKKVHYLLVLLKIAQAKPGTGKSFVKKIIKLFVQPLLNLYGEKRLANHLKSLAQDTPYTSAKWVGGVTWGLNGIGERVPKNEFEKTVFLEFEGLQLPTFSCWEMYLKGMYGDYMKLPPEEKRLTHEMAVHRVEKN